MRFQILSHAGLLVEGAGVRLVTDPWLVGSTYWRSWWNYPPVPRGLIRSLKPDFIYLTHMHWDHFQAASLRKFDIDTPVIIPKAHFDRMRRDLAVDLSFRNIRELAHGESMELAPGFKLTSYQFSPFLDSALVVECDGVTLLNANDAKFMGLALKQIVGNHPDIDFVFRSHSSANGRICFDVVDDPQAEVDDSQAYIRGFAAFTRAVGARYAIPFASNHCHLHKDVYAFNHTIKTPRMAADYFREEGIESPQLQIMLSGDSWSSASGFDISPTTMDYFDHRDAYLAAYLEKNAGTLEAYYATEDKAQLRMADVERYFARFFAAIPWPLRRRFKGRPVRFVLKAGDRSEVVEVDVAARRVRRLTEADLDPDNPLEIHTSLYIFNHAMEMNILSCIATSKRVRYAVTAENIGTMKLFNFLIDLHYCELLPLRNNLRGRSLANWSRRWRELIVLGQLTMDQLLTGKLSEEKYLTSVKPRRRAAPAPLEQPVGAGR